MVRPIDVQDNLSKISLIEKIQNMQQASEQIAHEKFVHDLNQAAQEKLRKTQNSKETEKAREREKRRGKREKRKGKDGVTHVDFISGDEEKTPMPMVFHHKIDIKV